MNVRYFLFFNSIIGVDGFERECRIFFFKHQEMLTNQAVTIKFMANLPFVIVQILIKTLYIHQVTRQLYFGTVGTK